MHLQFQVSKALLDVGLTEQADTKAAKLSGGQKRKLSVAMALIGDPKVRRDIFQYEKPIDQSIT